LRDARLAARFSDGGAAGSGYTTVYNHAVIACHVFQRICLLFEYHLKFTMLERQVEIREVPDATIDAMLHAAAICGRCYRDAAARR
jgi:acyl CoA:acetate/3-ketoacid CoA transferase alpha subunit